METLASTPLNDDWFTAVIVHAIVVGDTEDLPLDVAAITFSATIRVFAAPSMAEAASRARDLGLADEATYFNADGEVVNWRFAEVLDVREMLAAPSDGAEVYSWLMSGEVFDAIRRRLSQRS
jgi:hypothetical protein